LDYVFRAAIRATELVKQMLTFSRQADQERMPLLLHPIVGEALKLLRASLPSNIRMDAEISPDCPPVLADANQIHQIVMNLCANAYHAVNERDGGIKVSLAPVSVTAAQAAARDGLREGAYAVMEVRDSGTGMDEATVARVFDPFFTTKVGEAGDGLGAFRRARCRSESRRGHRGRERTGPGVDLSSLPARHNAGGRRGGDGGAGSSRSRRAYPVCR